MSMAQVIRAAMKKQGVTVSQLSRQLGCTTQNISGKMRRDNFRESELQEIVQENGTQPVEYILTKEEGPDHNKNFTVEARVNGKVMGQGSGHTKKAAEQAAAYQAIRVLRK